MTRDLSKRRLVDRRRHLWAKVQFAWLIYLLGGKCAVCSRDTELTVDHVDGKTWNHRRMPFRDRVRRYWQEFVRGVRLRVLCHACNSLDGSLRAQGTTLDEELKKAVPF